MSTSRTLIITSGLVGAISLMLRSMLSFSFTGSQFFVIPTFTPLFIIINCIIFALAASTSLLTHESDSSATKHYQDDDDDHHTYFYDHDDHLHDHHDDHDRSSHKSSNSSFDQYSSNNDHEEKKFPVRSENKGSHVVAPPENRFPSTKPEKPVGLRRPPTAPLKTFSRDDVSGYESMEEMWNRVKAEKQWLQPNTWQGQVIPKKNPKKSTASCPSPSRARKLPPSSPPRKKLTERIPSWVKLKKELSMGRDELNSQVEAFITKFKDEMKLQRLESIKRYNLFSRRSDAIRNKNVVPKTSLYCIERENS